MSETAVVGIVGVIGAVVAAAIGAAIAGHYSNRQQEQQRADKERDLMRAAMVEMITAARLWLDSVGAVSQVAAGTLGKGSLEHWAYKVFPTLEQAKHVGDARIRLQRELANVRLIATDRELADWLSRLEEHQRNWWEIVVEAPLRTEGALDLMRWNVYRDEFSTLFRGAQERARALVSG